MSIELKDTNKPGLHGNIFRNAAAGPSLAADGGVQTMHEVWRRTVDRHGDKPAVGYRPLSSSGEALPFEWSTYSQVDERAALFGSGLRALDLCPPNNKDFPTGTLGFYAKNRMEWTVGEQGCVRQGIIQVPFYDTLGVESVAYVVDQTEVVTVLCTSVVAANLVSVAVEGKGASSLRNIVLMDAHSQDSEAFQAVLADAQARTGKDGIPAVNVIAWMDVEKAGAANPTRPTPPAPHDVAFFCYTSGTTGNPKGALLTHVNMVSSLAGVKSAVPGIIRDDGSSVHLSYLPLPHVFERLNQMVIIANGGRIGYYQGDPLKILDDLTALRPTFFPSVPRLLSRIYDKIIAGVQEAGGVKAMLFNQALAAKVANLRTDQEGAGCLTHRVWDALVFNPLKKRLGLDRVEVMLTGSAPLSSDVMDFLRAVFGVPVVEGYGQTESAAAGTATRPDDYTTGHVGVPAPNCEIALFDCPEMGYLSTDTVHKNDDTQCRGRGEICFRGVNVIPEYYKMPAKTTATIDKDGWLHSGDIGVWTMEGKLRIVDRMKNIFKLSQGEYVAAEKIENIYGGSPLVMQSFVYGDSLQSCLVAIVVPDPEALVLWASKTDNNVPNGGKGMTLEQLCADPTVQKGIKRDLDYYAKKAELKGFENAKAIHVEPEQFSIEKGLMTPTFKLKRAQARDYYRPVIDILYEDLNKPKSKL